MSGVDQQQQETGCTSQLPAGSFDMLHMQLNRACVQPMLPSKATTSTTPPPVPGFQNQPAGQLASAGASSASTGFADMACKLRNASLDDHPTEHSRTLSVSSHTRHVAF
jgi:hypothetical protein